MTRIVFVGDSVTDGERDRTLADHLGTSYPLFVAGWLAAYRPSWNVACFNRGISGNRVRDLLERHHEDVLALEPNVISLLIGINDTWRRYDSADPTDTGSFRSTYEALLQKLNIPGKLLILCEPFLLPVRAEQWEWREDLDPKMAQCYGTCHQPQSKKVTTPQFTK